MKKLILLFTLMCITTLVYGQEKSYVYCELVGTGKFMSSKVNVQVDYGQETSFWKGVGYLKDEKGKKISFNSMVDAMNFFGKQGWEFMQAYVVTENNTNVYHWLLRKEVSPEDLDEVLSNN